MQLEELLPLFFRKEMEGKPYETETEYKEDLLRFLDMLLMIACSLKYLEGEGEPPVEIDNGHLRGIPITGKEVIASLQSNAIGKREELPYTDIKEILIQALTIIKSRTEQSSTQLKLKELSDKLDLSEVERFLLLLVWANYEDAKYELLYAYLQGDVRMKLPSLRMAVSLMELFQEIDRSEIVRIHRKNQKKFSVLFRRREHYDEICLAETFELSERVYGWLNGEHSLSSEIADIAVRMEKEPVKHSEDSQYSFFVYRNYEHMVKLISIMEEKTEHSQLQVLNIYGSKGNGRRSFVKWACSKLEKEGLCIDIVQVMENENIPEIIDKIYQEWVLSECILCFYYPVYEGMQKEEVSHEKLQQLLTLCRKRFLFMIWISEEKAEYLINQQFLYVSFEIESLSLKERYHIWQEHGEQYQIDGELDYQLLANQYLISIQGIENALWNADLLRLSEGRDQIQLEDIQNAVKQQSVNQLGNCAVRVSSLCTWDDLILPQEQKKQLEMIENQVKYKSVVGEDWGFYEKTTYGRGVCALFYGAPGTGKTMAAQVIANKLGLNLYRIDLSQLISKYVGETEKNISKVFQKARGINALLFFDEADSVFARRLDVKDSMDRSANAQTAHLLQEIEDYEGVTILATNLAINIDDAFKRRIKYMVKFAYPEQEIRYQLWTSILPEKAPCEEEIDFAFFSEHFELSGSSIKEILTAAAFMAASKHRSLRNEDIIEAIKLNYQKYGKSITNEELGYLI